MVSLSLVELSTKAVDEPKKEYTQKKLINPDFTMSSLSNFVIATNSVRSITEVKDVTKAIADGNYGFGANYTFLYLYEYDRDEESRNFISVYGGTLNNESSANINIVTFFSLEMKNRWENVQFRDKIVCDREHEYTRLLSTLSMLKDKYKVKSFPAMVVIKGGSKGDEDFCVVDFKGYRMENMYENFKHVIKVINDNCEEPFYVISQKINGSIGTTPNQNSSQFDLVDFIQDLINEEKREEHLKYTQVDLAEELGIVVRSLQNKKNKHSLTKKECCFLAIRFKLSITQLNTLLRSCGHLELGLAGMDEIIRKCLNNKNDVDETDAQLRKRGFDGILNNKSKKTNQEE